MLDFYEQIIPGRRRLAEVRPQLTRTFEFCSLTLPVESFGRGEEASPRISRAKGPRGVSQFLFSKLTRFSLILATMGWREQDFCMLGTTLSYGRAGIIVKLGAITAFCKRTFLNAFVYADASRQVFRRVIK